QRDNQRMIAPLALVVDADALFLFTGGWDLRAVGLNDRAIEKGVWLLPPHLLANAIEATLQLKNIQRAEPAAEIPGGGRIGDPLGAQGIQISFVAAAVFQVFQATAAGEQIQGDIENVVSLIVRQV